MTTQLDIQVVRAPFQKEIDGVVFPQILACRSAGATLADATAWIHEHRADLDRQLGIHTVLVLRGFPLRTAEDFDAVVQAFGYPGFTYKESLSNAVRVNRTERVFTANEAPCTYNIQLHHEMAQTPIFPSKLFFFCEKAAEKGGATPVCRSDALYDALCREVPQFMHDCETKGLKYRNNMPGVDDPSSGLGRSWQSTFGTTERSAAEARMSKLGYTWEWREDGSLKTITPVLQAVRRLDSGRKAFFNQLIAAALGWKDARNDPTKAVTYGDGTPLDQNGVQAAVRLSEQFTADVAWQTGDVALVDNYAAMHGRRTFEGKRAVLASLVKGEG